MQGMSCMWNSWSGRVRKWKISPIILKAGWDDKQIKSAVKLTGNHISPRGFPGGSDSKVSACNMGDSGLTPGWGRSPGEGNVNPLQYSCLEFQEQRSLAGYSPWSRKESDMSEQLTLPFIFLWNNAAKRCHNNPFFGWPCFLISLVDKKPCSP